MRAALTMDNSVEREVALLCEMLNEAASKLDDLNWACTSRTSGPLAKARSEHVAAALKLLSKLTAPDLD